MAAPFNADNTSIYGDYIQLSGSGASAPTGSNLGLSFIFASSSTGMERDTKLYFANGTGSAQLLGTDPFNFTVAADAGSNQAMTDGNTLTLVGGLGLASAASATDTVTFNVDMAGATDIGAALADADLFLVDDGAGGTIRKSTMARVMTYIEAGMDTAGAFTFTGDVSLSDNDLTNVGDINCDSISVDGAGTGLTIDFSGGSVTGRQMIKIPDNLAEALVIEQAGNDYLTFDSTNGSEQVKIMTSWTAAGRTCADLGSVTTADINGGSIDGTVIGAASAAAGTFAAVVASSLSVSDGNITNVGDIALDTISADDGSSFALGSNWTAASRTCADLGSVTTADINGGSIDGTVIGAAAVAAGSFAALVGTTATFSSTLAANGDVDLGNATSDTITATGRFDSDLTPSSDNARDLGAGALRYAQAHVVEAHIDQLGQALNGNSQNITQVASLQASRISGSVSLEGTSAYFTALSSSQLQDTSLTATRVVFAGSNGVLTDDSDMTFASDTLTVTKLGAYEAAGAINFASQAMTNVDINSGAIDGTVIGASSAAAGTFAAVAGTTATFSSTLNADGATTLNGAVTLGNATGDDITNTGRWVGDFVPKVDSAIDLGTSALQFAEAHVDHGYIDAITATGTSTLTTVDINGGAIDGTTIGASSAAAGSFAALDCDSLDVSDGNITNVGDINCDSVSVDDAAAGLKIDFSGGNTGLNEMNLADNLADALSIAEGSNDYMKFTTTNGQEGIGFGKMAAPLTDNAVMLGAGSFRWAQAHVVVAHLDQLGQALDANSQAITNINVDSGAIDGTVIGASSAAAATFAAAAASTVAVAGGSVSGDIALALPNNKDAKARAWITYSERSLKTNIEPMRDALATVNKMQGYSYDLKNGGKHEVGFMADEMASVVPEIVSFKKDGTAAGLDYGRLTSVLVEAIKAQQAQIDELKKQIK